jgi:ketosteroid isomerase-like protein/predicted SnoaL-like aldol condensation-catalyzing enzyme
MQKYLVITVLLAVVVGLSGFSGPAIAQEMDPAAVVEAVYTAVSESDIEGAVALMADDAVLTLVPPPEGLDGTFVGKQEIGAWFENLAAGNGRFEFSKISTSGNMATMKLAFSNDFFDNAIGGPAEFDGVAVVQDGLWKSVSWVFTPEFNAKFDAAMAREANDALVERILLEIWSEGNLDLADELVAEDYASHTWPVGEGRDDFKADVASWRTDFPGATIVVDRIVWDGNRAIIFSHNAELGGSVDKLPPEADIDDILVYQIENGQLSDRWYFAPFDPTQ